MSCPERPAYGLLRPNAGIAHQISSGSRRGRRFVRDPGVRELARERRLDNDHIDVAEEAAHDVGAPRRA